MCLVDIVVIIIMMAGPLTTSQNSGIVDVWHFVDYFPALVQIIGTKFLGGVCHLFMLYYVIGVA